MKESILLLVFVSLMISCTEESVEPEMTFHERLEKFITSSDKVCLVNRQNFESIPNPRLNSNSEMPPYELLVSKLSFQIFDRSAVLEIEQIFKNYGNPNLDFSAFLKLVSSVSSNARIEDYKVIWHYYAFSNGCETMVVCTNKSGDWECDSTTWCSIE